MAFKSHYLKKNLCPGTDLELPARAEVRFFSDLIAFYVYFMIKYLDYYQRRNEAFTAKNMFAAV
jgi:hypothetical protein